MRIRAASKDDLDTIERIETACFEKDKYNREILKLLLVQGDFLTTIAERDDAPIGYATIFRRKGCRSVRLMSIAVLPEQRGTGVADKLMEVVEDLAAETAADTLFLEVAETNVTAVSLYLRHGFEISGSLQDYYGRGRHAFLMSKSLRRDEPRKAQE